MMDRSFKAAGIAFAVVLLVCGILAPEAAAQVRGMTERQALERGFLQPSSDRFLLIQGIVPSTYATMGEAYDAAVLLSPPCSASAPCTIRVPVGEFEICTGVVDIGIGETRGGGDGDIDNLSIEGSGQAPRDSVLLGTSCDTSPLSVLKGGTNITIKNLTLRSRLSSVGAFYITEALGTGAKPSVVVEDVLLDATWTGTSASTQFGAYRCNGGHLTMRNNRIETNGHGVFFASLGCDYIMDGNQYFITPDQWSPKLPSGYWQGGELKYVAVWQFGQTRITIDPTDLFIVHNSYAEIRNTNNLENLIIAGIGTNSTSQAKPIICCDYGTVEFRNVWVELNAGTGTLSKTYAIGVLGAATGSIKEVAGTIGIYDSKFISDCTGLTGSPECFGVVGGHHAKERATNFGSPGKAVFHIHDSQFAVKVGSWTNSAIYNFGRNGLPTFSSSNAFPISVPSANRILADPNSVSSIHDSLYGIFNEILGTPNSTTAPTGSCTEGTIHIRTLATFEGIYICNASSAWVLL